MKKNALIYLSIIFVTIGCFKKEKPPQDWLDWTQKAQERFNEKIAVPSTLQHIYVTLAEEEFYLSKSESGDYKLVKISSFDTDQKYVLDFDKEEVLSNETTVSLAGGEIVVNERISLKVFFYKEETSSKARVFLYDQEISNLSKKRERKFYPYSSKYKKEFVFNKLKESEQKTFGRSDGTTREFNKIGNLKLSDDSGDSLSLYAEPEQTEKKIMLMFKDATSGSSTYGAGRYVVVDLPSAPMDLVSGDIVNIDFNYTFNPPCAVSAGFHCPLAQDLLRLKVKAGEKYYKH